MNKAERVGGQIRHYRELAGLTKSEVARRVGVTPTAVHNWEENGVMPRMETIFALEKVLEVDFMQLWGSRRGGDPARPAPAPAPAPDRPEASRGDRLEQLRRQVAALFDVPADRVEITIRT
jgi:transcriptional regulator with XRE-family HTH domain